MKKLIVILFLMPVFAFGQTYTGDKFNARVSIKSPLYWKGTDTLVSKLDTAKVNRNGALSKFLYSKLNNIWFNTTTQSIRIGELAGISENETDWRAGVYVGYGAGSTLTTGTYNTYLGYYAGWKNKIGQYNTVLGGESFKLNTKGNYNTTLGYQAGGANKYGSSNIYIGYQSRLFGVAYSNELVIDNQPRGSTANDSALVKTSAIIYGVMSNTVANQTLAINGSSFLGIGVNNTQFEADGSLLMNGNATVFDDLMFPFSTGHQVNATYPSFDSDSLFFNWGVDTVGVDAQYMYFIIQMPHSWKEGSTIFPHVHYKHETAVGTPTFKIKYKWYNIGTTIGTGWKWYTMATTTGTTDKTHQIVYKANGLSGAGKTISSIIVLKVYLSAQTGTGNVHAWQMDLHIEKDRLGSRSETSK